MRNTVTKAAALLLALCLLTGCDFFRKLAGRPTSEEIRAKSEALARAFEEEAEKESARLDSIERATSYSRDSLAALDLLRQENLLNPGRSGGLRDAGAGYRKYYIIVGSFSNKDNAGRLAGDISSKGYPVEAIPFKNGFTAVGLCGTDDVVEIRRSLEDVKRQDFCPKGIWILVNE